MAGRAIGGWSLLAKISVLPGAPETFLVNPQGIVAHKFIGPLTLEAWQSEFVPRLPPQPAAKS